MISKCFGNAVLTRLVNRGIKFLAVLQDLIFTYNVERGGVRKGSEMFRAKLYCKMSNLFRQILLALRLSAGKT